PPSRWAVRGCRAASHRGRVALAPVGPTRAGGQDHRGGAVREPVRLATLTPAWLTPSLTSRPQLAWGGTSGARQRWLVLAIVLAGAFLVMVAISTANLAAPSMRSTLGASFGQIQLVVAGYVLVYAVFLIAGGRLGDLYGRKLVLIAGIAIFTLGAAA